MRNEARAVIRQPRFRVLADGALLEGVFEIKVVSTDHFSPSHFQIRTVRGSSFNGCRDCLSIRDDAFLEVQVSMNESAGFSSLVSGRGDTLCYDHLTRSIRIEGRDLAALLQDNAANDVFSNLTSSEIATTLALRRGLIPLAVPTTVLAGRYYHNDTSQLAYNQFNRASTEWDMLAFLARCESFELFVSGRVLYFQPNLVISKPAVVLNPDDLMELRLRRRLRMSGDISVTVRSWNSKQNEASVQTAISRRTDLSGIFSSIWSTGTMHYSLVQPNLSESEAARIALSRVDELARHEVGVEILMPGELTLGPRSLIALQGTNSVFDQLYQVDSIERTLGGTSGFLQRISAHSISTRRSFLVSETVSP